MMEDLRITGYNALLTPAFLQEEFPTVSLDIHRFILTFKLILLFLLTV